MGLSRRQVGIGLGIGIVTAAGALSVPVVRRVFHPLVLRWRGRRTVEDRLAEFAGAKGRVAKALADAGVSFPPGRVVLLGLKAEKRLEVYAGPADDSLRRIVEYPVLAASGGPGPKLREGDRQVPEGIYPLESLNPNSRFHAALRVGYPNDFDQQMAQQDGRTQLGGDIMIHGGNASVGCLAIGDPAIEDLFVLAATAALANVTVVLAPVDLRQHPLPPNLDHGWQHDLYASIRDRLATLPG